MIDTQKELLHSKHLKSTPIREEIIRFLNQSEEARSMTQLKNQLSGADRVTLYRAVKTLEATGVIHEAARMDGEAYYAMCTGSCSSEGHHHQHIHLHCKSCESIHCREISIKIPTESLSFQTDNIDIRIDGICESCLNKRKD